MPGTLALLKQAGLLESTDDASLTIADIGCGTGVCTSILQQSIPNRISQIVGIDRSAAMIDSYQKRAIEESWKATSAYVADVQQPIPQVADSHFDVIVAGYTVFGFPEFQKGLQGASMI